MVSQPIFNVRRRRRTAGFRVSRSLCSQTSKVVVILSIADTLQQQLALQERRIKNGLR